MSIITKAIEIRSGNGICRKYRNAKINRNLLAGTTLLDFSVASMDALEKNASGTIIMGLLTCFILKLCKDCHCSMLKLKPQHDAIVARAKKIFKS